MTTPNTADFATLCDCQLKIFDHLGAFMYYAKVEMNAKNQTLKDAAPKLPTLAQMVEADQAAGTVTTKGSCSRSLHRLIVALDFLRELLKRLFEDPTITPATATWQAYEVTLGTIHTYVVRQAVWTATFALPTRVQFLESIQETEESVKQNVDIFIKSAVAIIARLDKIFGVEMPVSESLVPVAPAGLVPI
jgi:hypothetical protein